MAVELPGFLTSREAGSVVSQHRFVTLASDGQVDHTGAGAQADGVSQDDGGTAAGRAVGLMLLGGITKVEAGAAVTRGAEVASDASGRAVAAVTGDRILGRAWEAASGAGVKITVNTYSGPIAP
jgi:hypothetical protein